MRPFRIEVSQEQIDDLHRRIDATRWPTREVGPAWSSGVPLDWLQALARAWRQGYDWRERERRFNAVPQILAPIDGIDVHAIVLRAPDPAARAIILTHGWPGTFAEYLEVGRRLADPSIDGGDPAAAMHVVIPSLPGYGFSGIPSDAGWGVERIADAWAELMTLLGHAQFFAAGSDWGTSVSAALGLRHPDRIRGLTLIPPLAAPDPHTFDSPTVGEAAARARLTERERDGSAYSEVHETRPQTIGYALTDSPVGLLAWIGEKYAQWAGQGGVPHDDILDAASIYWFTGTAGSSARLYRESIEDVSGYFTDAAPTPIDVPVVGVMFPDEVPWISQRWAARRFPDIREWIEPQAGGHFGALERPADVVAAIRSTMRSCPG